MFEAVQELEPPKYREILSDFVWDMVNEMDFWLNRMENVTVSFLTLTKEKDVPVLERKVRETYSRLESECTN